MPRDPEDTEDVLDDRELPDEADMDDDDDPDLLPCPHCRKMINEDTVRCPHCGDYISREDNPDRRTPWFLLLIAGLVLIVILWSFLR